MGALISDVVDKRIGLTSKVKALASTEFNPWTTEIFP